MGCQKKVAWFVRKCGMGCQKKRHWFYYRRTEKSGMGVRKSGMGFLAGE